MVGFDLPVAESETPRSQLENPAGYRRIAPEEVAQFASEFGSLLSDVRAKPLSLEGARRMDAMVDVFEELVREMRAASQDIRKLLAE